MRVRKCLPAPVAPPSRAIAPSANAKESLILSCPAGASKDEAGVPASDGCREPRLQSSTINPHADGSINSRGGSISLRSTGRRLTSTAV
ncbi:hypothetical protein GFL39_29865 [Rhizobium leguminosarum bv. viciae]|nr:hypothetical protein [Rhizobium leguminosarum bv. viciae]NKL09029.1 hypothetical protein [Rhizobium leguminosarum bv. viciae]NKL84868.1 hypothetical protein [Rhizobium leguminosarum bv. viciae]NKL94764.1 hypothetical protein [Rhizobium leguminosarum bv. viciae]NKM95015.1 hypothetical protein [Rhizobium leguminosarum bv. viciae]